MSEQRRDELLESNYDGIQEYDNDLPRWWTALFGITVVGGLAWAVYVHAMSTKTDDQQLASDMQTLEAQRVAFEQAHAPKSTGPEQLLALAADTAHVEKGKAIYTMRCAACHGQKAEGLVGPNLTDEFWIHGGKIEQVHETIVKGVPEKGMLAWKGVMPPEEIDDVTAYIWSVRNTNIPGKAPQGDKS